MIGLVLVVFGAISDPTIPVGGLELTAGEVRWLAQARISTLQRVVRTMDSYLARQGDDTSDSVDLQTEADGLTGAARAAKLADKVALEEGANVRQARRVKAVKAALASRPGPVQARRHTLSRIYDRQQNILLTNGAGNDTLDGGEANLPAFLFVAIDGDSDGELSVTELRTYWDGL